MTRASVKPPLPKPLRNGNFDAIAAGADGLIIEAHDDPEHALTDGAQSITPKTLKDMMRTLKKIAEAVDREI